MSKPSMLFAYIFSFNLFHYILNTNGLDISYNSSKISSYNNNSLISEVDETASNHQSRTKRFLTYNIDGSFDVGFLLVIPIAIVIPPMSNLFNAWRYNRRRRSYNSQVELKNESEDVTYFDNPHIQAINDQIQTCFNLVQITEKSCQQRAICEFSAELNKFYPLSNVILEKLHDPMTEELLSIEHEKNNITESSLQTFIKASEIGTLHGIEYCHEFYRMNCPFSIEQRLNLPLLKFWKAMESLLHLKFDLQH